MTATLTFVGGVIPTRTDFEFLVQDCINPPDVFPTSSFTNIFTTDSSDQSISGYSNAVNFATTTPGTITASSLSQADKTANALTEYTITITT